MVTQLSESGAETILSSFEDYIETFNGITARAELHFRNRSWAEMRSDTGHRLDIYKKTLVDGLKALHIKLGAHVGKVPLWKQMKHHFARIVAHRPDRELAETWFNSMTRSNFSTVGINPEIEFLQARQNPSDTVQATPLYRTYRIDDSIRNAIATALTDVSQILPFTDMDRDVHLVSEKIENFLQHVGAVRFAGRIELIAPVFFRGMGAYMVGRIFLGNYEGPLVIAVLNPPDGIRVDAVLLSESDVSILFSYTRSAFQVTCDRPLELVHYLKAVLPRKKIAELYTAIGFERHGKTEHFRDLREHLAYCCGEQFEIAPGQRGMVMEVFSTPGYDVVFKLIKDHFARPKTSTARDVMAKYDLVFKHDRAGRLVEPLSFERLTFDRCCFSAPLLKTLSETCRKTVRTAGDQLSLEHVYLERKVIPLDIYINGAEKAAAEAAVIDFGNAIKDLARSNIFPGDLLLKNFGVTRHGRVVFYDYDELCLLTECRFRRKPPPRIDEDVMSDEPWYLVQENDTFPEEFESFLGLPPLLMDRFRQIHGDLFDIEFWQLTQQRILSDNMCHIFPYPRDRRLDPPDDSVCGLWDDGCGC